MPKRKRDPSPDNSPLPPPKGEDPLEVTIVGGGIIGASIAYYLHELAGPDVRVTIIERETIACAASGKAAGFLQSNWAATEDRSHAGGLLSELSFKLHRKLASKFGEENIQYRPIQTYCSYSTGMDIEIKCQNKDLSEYYPSRSPDKEKEVQEWFNVGRMNTTAQVHPKLLTEALVRASEAKVISRARLVGIQKNKKNSRITGLQCCISIQGDQKRGKSKPSKKTLPVKSLVCFCMGPWTSELRQWGLHVPRIIGMKSHGLVLQPTAKSGGCPQKVAYLESPGISAEYSILEVYPRPDGSVFVNGKAERMKAVRTPATKVLPSRGSLEGVLKCLKSTAPSLSEYKVGEFHACHYPMPPDEKPVIGKISGTENAFIASGHMYWGIANAPATGMVVAQMMLGMNPSLDLTEYSPSRFFRKKKERSRPRTSRKLEAH